MLFTLLKKPLNFVRSFFYEMNNRTIIISYEETDLLLRNLFSKTANLITNDVIGLFLQYFITLYSFGFQDKAQGLTQNIWRNKY